MFDRFVNFLLEHTWRKLSLGLRVGLQIPIIFFLAFIFSFSSNPRLTQPENFRTDLSMLLLCYSIVMLWRLGIFKDTYFGMPNEHIRLYAIMLMEFLIMGIIAMIFAIIESWVFSVNIALLLEANLLLASILQCFAVVKEARVEELEHKILAQMKEKIELEEFATELDAEAEAICDIYADLDGWLHERCSVLYENDESIMVVIPRHEVPHVYH